MAFVCIGMLLMCLLIIYLTNVPIGITIGSPQLGQVHHGAAGIAHHTVRVCNYNVIICILYDLVNIITWSYQVPGLLMADLMRIGSEYIRSWFHKPDVPMMFPAHPGAMPAGTGRGRSNTLVSNTDTCMIIAWSCWYHWYRSSNGLVYPM